MRFDVRTDVRTDVRETVCKDACKGLRWCRPGVVEGSRHRWQLPSGLLVQIYMLSDVGLQRRLTQEITTR